jgi:hypothetical protein
MDGEGPGDAGRQPRWTAKAAVRKEDQFTAAPDFLDDHDSRPLPLWGRIEASWHGLSRTRRVVLMASIALFATWGGTSAAFALDDLGRSESPSPGGGLAADDAGSPVDGVGDALPSGLPGPGAGAADGNSTAPGTLPPLPPGLPGSP